MVSNWLSNRMALTSSAFIAGAFLISGCGGSGNPQSIFGSAKIDCASNETVEKVKSIAIEQGIFLELIKLNSPNSFRWKDDSYFWMGMPSWRAACAKSPTCGKALDRAFQLETEIADARKAASDAKEAAYEAWVHEPGYSPREPSIEYTDPPELVAEHRVVMAEVEMEFKKIKSSIDADWDRSSKEIKYTLTDIVTFSRNDELHSVGCKATLNGDIAKWNSANVTIDYTVEKTSDGDALVTLLGR